LDLGSWLLLRELEKADQAQHERDPETLSLLTATQLRKMVIESLHRDLVCSNGPCTDDSPLQKLRKKQDYILYLEIEPLTIEEDKCWYDMGINFWYYQRKEMEKKKEEEEEEEEKKAKQNDKKSKTKKK
jgi:hypothetical protein